MLAAMLIISLLAAPVCLLPGRHPGWLVAMVPLTLFLMLCWMAGPVVSGVPLYEATSWGVQSLGIQLALRLDALSLLFGLVITAGSVLVSLYAGYDMRRDTDTRWLFCYLLLLMGAMLGLVLGANTLTLAVFWQLTALSAFFLVGYQGNDPQVRSNAQQVFLLMMSSGLLVLVGMLLLGQSTTNPGSIEPQNYTFDSLLNAGTALPTMPLYTPALLLLVAGCSIAAAQFPLHFWVWRTMQSPTAARLSLAVSMGLAGVYLLARLHPVLGNTALWQSTLAIVGAGTLLAGAILSLCQGDMKRILASLMLSQHGGMVLLLGLGGNYAPTGLTVSVLCSALSIVPLCMLAGIIERIMRTDSLRQPGQVYLVLQKTTVLTVIAALSLAGMPLSLGFIARELLFESIYTSSLSDAARYMVLAVSSVGVILTIVATGHLILEVFFRTRSFRLPSSVRDAPLKVLLAPAIPALLTLLMGLPIVGVLIGAEALLVSAASVVAGEPVQVGLAVWQQVGPALVTTLSVLFLGGVLIPYRRSLIQVLTPPLQRIHLSRAFDAGLYGLQLLSNLLVALVERSKLSVSLTIAVIAWLALVAPLSITSGALQGVLPNPAEIWQKMFSAEVMVVLLLLIGLIMVLKARLRLTALIGMALLQGMIALLFALSGAPDIALLEVLVAALVMVFLLLVLSMLPAAFAMSASRIQHLANTLIACSAGLLMAGLSLSGTPAGPVSPAQSYIGQNLPLARGTNMVNVILTDFRSFDTLGVTIILFIVLLGVYGLLRLR